MTVKIIPYDAAYRQAFYDLNVEWLATYFVVEPIDETVLSDPEAHILDKGGEIFFALLDGEAIGTVALKKDSEGIYELTKLAVRPKVHKGGIGTLLCEKVIDEFQAKKGGLLFLDTNTKLPAAIRIYKRLNFIEKERPEVAPYDRADYYMEWQPS